MGSEKRAEERTGEVIWVKVKSLLLREVYPEKKKNNLRTIFCRVDHFNNDQEPWKMKLLLG